MTPGPLDHRQDPYSPSLVRAIRFAAILFLLAGAQGLAAPDDLGGSAVASALEGSAQRVWLGLYALGGLLVVIGISAPRLPGRAGRRRPELEVVGLWQLIGGGAINLLVIFAIRGPLPDGASLTTVGLLFLALRMLHGRVGDLAGLVAHSVLVPPWDRRRMQEPLAHPDRRTEPSRPE